jgi:trk system potassium uptake protein TrkH
MTVFIPKLGARGIWVSIFNSVSAFCNAGMDILGENSLCDYALHPVVNAVTCLLIVLGGIGYIVWWDVLRVMRSFPKQRLHCFQGLTLHSKIALFSSFLLIILGAAVVLLLEWNNPLTLQGHSLFNKLQLALFQSVTTRTAGFVTLPQQNMTNGSSVFSLMLMFIGGSPVGTAGGVKTVTVAVLLISAFSTIRGQESVAVFHRRISRESVGKAAAVVCMSFVIAFLSTLLLSAVTDASFLDILYESVSAAATVGLRRDLTPSLNVWGKVIIIITMYLGRVGPISLAIAFNLKQQKQNIILDPVEDISIG